MLPGRVNAMRLTDPLYAVIRRATRDARAATRAEKVVILDPRRRQIVEDNWRTRNILFSDFEYYLVLNTNDPRNMAQGSVPVKVSDLVTNRALSLSVSYSATCTPGNEQRLAIAMCGGTRPGEIFHTLIAKWVNEFAGTQPGAFIEQFFNRKDALKTYITNHALSEAGLTLGVDVSPDGLGDVSQAISVELKDLPVRLRDRDAGQQLTLSTQLIIDEPSKINAYLYQPSNEQWTTWVSETVSNYLAENVSLDEFCTGLNRGPVWAGLMSYLDSGLKMAGRRLAFLRLEGKWDRQGERLEFYESHINVEYRIQGYSEPITIKCTVQMILRNRALFLNSGASAPEDWLNTNLQEVVKLALFGKKYIDLLLRFNSLEREIKTKLSFRAAAIGYDIQQLITIPDLEEYTLLENITTEIYEEFSAKDSRSRVKLKLIIIARIRQLQDVADYLNRDQDVRKKMREAILEETRQLLHTIDLARLYMRFYFTEKVGEETVAKLLEDKIRDVLTQKFKAEISTVTLHLETPYDRLLREIAQKIRVFSVTISGPRDIGAVTITGDFQVLAIHSDYWEKFQMMNLDLDEITVQLEKNLLSEMEAVPLLALTYESAERARTVKNWVREVARNYVLETYGLVIEVSNLRRQITGPAYLDELYRSELEADVATEKFRIDKLRKLKQDRINLLTAGVPKAQIEKLDEQIEILESSRVPVGLPPREEARQLSAADSFSLPNSSGNETHAPDDDKRNMPGTE